MLAKYSIEGYVSCVVSQSQNYQLQKDSLHKSFDREVVSKFAFLPHKWSKYVDFWGVANHPAVHSGGVAGGGSMAVAVGVSYM